MVAFSLIALLIAVAWWGCSSSSEDCAVTEDCFSDETCVDGTCRIVLGPTNGANDDSNGDANDDTNGEDNSDSNANQSLVDCMENVGICGDRYCEPDTRECVECVRNDHCDTNLECGDENICRCPSGMHECYGECVVDDDPNHCGQRCEPCPDEAGAEPVCIDGECDLECEPGFESCTGPGCEFHCLECETHDDCTDPGRSRCYEGRCQGCATSEDCAHNEDTPVCDRDAGVCIQCTVEESGACSGNSCNPATNECTDTPLRSLSFCDRCVADEECLSTQRCVPMKFAGQDRPDGYCLYRESLRDCESPFPIHLQRASLSGFPPTRYCGIREEKLTCEALDDYFDRCDSHAECGAPDLDDGKCIAFYNESDDNASSYRCTHDCTDDHDCHIVAICTNPTSGHCVQYEW